MVQLDGSFVAGYELSGLNSYYHDDEMRNRSKHALEALVRSLPERSMRMQMRFEITEGIGAVRAALSTTEPQRECRAAGNGPVTDGAVGPERGERLLSAAPAARLLHLEPANSPRAGRTSSRARRKKRFSLSVEKCIQRERREHEDFVSEFGSLLAGVEQTLVATGMGVRRMTRRRNVSRSQAGSESGVRRPEPVAGAGLRTRRIAAPGSQIVNTSIEDEQESYIRSAGFCTPSSV